MTCRAAKAAEVERVGFLLKVRQDRIEDYKAHHRAVWPDMLAALERHGWRNYSLFLAPDGSLFGYFEAEEDFQSSLAGMAGEAVNDRWQAFMAEYFEGLEGFADQGMLQLEQVFFLE